MWQPSRPGAVLAVDFGGTKVAVTTGDGTQIRAVEFTPGADPREILDLAARLGEEVRSGQPEVVSISTPGVIRDGRALLAPNIVGWEDIDLIAWAKRHFAPHQVAVTNDVEAAGWAEALAGSLEGVDIGLYVNLGTGIAAASVVHGRVVHGSHGMAGEIGYARTGPTETIGWSGDDAPLELLAGGVGLRNSGIVLPLDMAASWLDGPEGQAAGAALDELARHLLTCVLLLDPRLVVLGGGLARVPLVVEHLGRRLREGCPVPMPVSVSRFGRHASVLGALTLGTKMKGSR